MKKTFRGGVADPILFQKKQDGAQVAFRLIVPDRVFLPLIFRHRALVSCVGIGDAVQIGQTVIIDQNGHLPPFHSGVSGTVSEVGILHPSADGGAVPTLIIENDHKQTAYPFLPPLTEDCTSEQIVQRMYDGGLMGMGGGGFPTHTKYRGMQAEWLLINGCECEPFLCGDVRLCIEAAASVARGARLFAKAAGVSVERIRLCVESEQAQEALQRTGLTVCRLPRRYPQGAERQLIYSVLSVSLPDGVFPVERGIVVSNVATAVAMADAASGLTLTHRSVTVSGTVDAPVNLIAPIGTPFTDLLAAVSAPEGRKRYIAGGPMTGRRLTSLSAGLTKTCGGLTVLPPLSFEETPCIRCGACVRVCPADLFPFAIDRAALLGDRKRCATLRAEACIRCGCCSYVCPAHRQLAARIGAVQNRGGMI